MDTSGPSASDRIDIVIDAGQIASLQQHVGSGRLDFTHDANRYPECGAATALRLDQ